MSRCRYCRELLSEGEECDCPGVEKEAECVILRRHLDLLANPSKERKRKRPVDLEQIIRDDREEHASRISAYRTGIQKRLGNLAAIQGPQSKAAMAGPSLKKPGPLPKSTYLKGEGPTASDEVLKDRDWPEGYFESFGPVGEDFPTSETNHQRPNTLEDVQKAITLPRQKRRVGEIPFTPAQRKTLKKLDPYDLAVMWRVHRKSEGYDEVLEAVRLQTREACARVALQISRRSALAGDTAGADAARQIAIFLREETDWEN